MKQRQEDNVCSLILKTKGLSREGVFIKPQQAYRNSPAVSADRCSHVRVIRTNSSVFPCNKSDQSVEWEEVSVSSGHQDQ